MPAVMASESDVAEPSALMRGAALRPLVSADAIEAAEVIRTAFAAQRKATRPPSSALLETSESIAAKIGAGGGIGAFAEGTLIGLSLWRLGDGALEIGRVAVLPAWRGRGIVRALMAALETEAMGRGAGRMTLRVRLELPENERLFNRFGFVRRRVEAHAGFDAPTTAVMEKSLS
jgi:ribosomal protein S18 acetylase RimI-like enzyme